MNPEISIVIPCLNEEEGIASCLIEVKAAIRKYELAAEVIVVDNNSTDKTAEIVRNEQANFPELVLVREDRGGYGLAYLKGFSEARGKYIFMADGDREGVRKAANSVIGLPIITVAQVNEFPIANVMFNLIVVDDKVAFQVNTVAAKNQQLDVSAKLIRLARDVH